MNFTSLNTFLPIFSIIISIFAVVGGFIAFRQGYFKQSSEIQSQTIEALKTRVDTLESQALSDQKEIKRLRTVINTVRYALKRKGMLIEIDGEYVTLIESDGQSKSTHLREDDPKVRPIKTRIKNEDDIDVS